MKKLRLITLLFFFLLAVTCVKSIAGNKIENQDIKKSISKMKRYGVKKARIEYTLSGTQTGTETLYFDEWGMREAKYTKTELKILGITQKTNTATFIEDTWIYTVDLDKKTGTKTENTMLKALEGQNLEDVGKQMMIKMGGKKVGSEKILGDKDTEIWEMQNMGTKIWLWNGIPLKTETNMMGMKISNVATKIQFDFPKKYLEKPTDVDFSKTEDPMKMLQKMRQKYQQN